MKKRNILVIIGVICVIAAIVILCFIGDKNLDINDKRINELYEYLGEVDIYHCGGLNAYNSSSVTKDSISNTNLLCMAYYNLDEDNMSLKTAKSTGTNKSNNKICKISDNVTFTTEEDSNECNYVEIKKEDLNEAYKDLYGSKIKEEGEFYITSDEACYLEGDTYYCGNAETFTVSLAPASSIYRLIDRAIEKRNGEIDIYDYFLKITEDKKCYITTGSDNENEDCTKNLAKMEEGFNSLNDEEKAEFMRKYGQIYKHTFIYDNNDYYWSKSEQK